MASNQPGNRQNGADSVSRRSVLGLLGAVPVAAGAVLATGSTAAASTPGYRQSSVPPPRGLAPGGSFDRQLAQFAAQDQFSGTVLLVHRDTPVLTRAYGMANKQLSIPNRLDTIIAMASVTKLFTATAIMQLVEQGTVELYHTIGSYLDGFPAPIAGTVTVHQLLTHTAGLGDYLSDPAYLAEQSTWTSAAETMDGIMAVIEREPLLFTPGTQYSYSNSGYATLGAIAARVSGRSYYDYVREHIFAPAGMTRSDFYTKPEWLTNSDIAHPYSTGGRSNPNPGGPRVDIIDAEDFIGSPAGNAFSTAPDMARFARALSDGRLLSRAYADLMTGGKVPLPPHRNQSDIVGYGPDTRIVNDRFVFGHTGGAAGETTVIDVYPDLDWVTVMLSNYDVANTFQALLPLLDQLITQPGT